MKKITKVLTVMFLFVFMFMFAGCQENYEKKYDLDKEVTYKEELSNEQIQVKLAEISENQTTEDKDGLTISVKIKGQVDVQNDQTSDQTEKEDVDLTAEVKMNTKSKNMDLSVKLDGKMGDETINAFILYQDDLAYVSLDAKGAKEEENVSMKFRIAVTPEVLEQLMSMIGSMGGVNPDVTLPGTTTEPEMNIPSFDSFDFEELLTNIQKAGTDKDGNFVIEANNDGVNARVVFKENDLVFVTAKLDTNLTCTAEFSYDAVTNKKPDDKDYPEKSLTELMLEFFAPKNLA